VQQRFSAGAEFFAFAPAPRRAIIVFDARTRCAFDMRDTRAAPQRAVDFSDMPSPAVMPPRRLTRCA